MFIGGGGCYYMLTYSQDAIRNMALAASKKYQGELDKTLELPSFLNNLIASIKTENGQIHGVNTLHQKGYPRLVRIAPSVTEMFNALNSISMDLTKIDIDSSLSLEERGAKRKELILSVIKPVKEFYFDPYSDGSNKDVVGGDGIWWGDCIKGINCRPGLVNNDPSKSYPFIIGGNKVHGILGGDTGQGKSVVLNALMTSLLTEYPPWELSLYMCDMKKLEFGRYAQSYRCPQIKVIASTESASYLVSVLEFLEWEMKRLSDIGTILGAQNLAGIRNYLGMCIPRNFIPMDEFSQLYANGTAREIRYADFLLQSIAKLGRSFGYHLYPTSQVFSGTIPSDVLKQFAVGTAVGCDESTSEAIIGNGKAETLLTKIGYCIANNSRKLGNKSGPYNVEYKVAFLDEESDEGKAKMQNILKRVCDVTNRIDLDIPMQFFNESLQPGYEGLFDDMDKVLPDVEQVVEDKKLEKLHHITLGESMRFTGKSDSREFFILDYSRRSNIIVHSKEVGDIKYLCKLVGDNLNNCPIKLTHKMFIDNRELFDEGIIENYSKSLTGEFPLDAVMNTCKSRDGILKYNLDCESNMLDTSFIGYLRFINSKVNDGKTTAVCDAMRMLTDAEVGRYLNLALNREDDGNDVILKSLREHGNVGDLLGKYNAYTSNMSRRKGKYLRASEFPTFVYWMFSPQKNESLTLRGSFREQFNDLLSLAPSVGLFFVLVVDDPRGSKQTLLNARHLITCKPHQTIENFEFGSFNDTSGIGCKYKFLEGEDDQEFYFKKYLKLE